jgi:phosphoribosylformylglycinamidine cyclo-ligase
MNNKNKMNYKKAGVDIEAGDQASKILYEASKATFENRKNDVGEVIVPFDDFSGLRVIDTSSLPKDTVMCLSFDGVGTKVEVAQRMNNHKTIAFDLLAMVCDDAIVRGAEPVVVGSVLDFNKLDVNTVKELAQGYKKAAEDAGVAIINGELAELGNAVGGFGSSKYNWCSGLLWMARKEKLLTGKEIREDDSIVLFEEKGFRSNGLSLVRKVFEKTFGDDWHKEVYENELLGNHVLLPSKIYSKALVHMHGGVKKQGVCEVHGVAHITGGGLPGKLGRVLKPSGFGAKLNNLFEPCKAMTYCQKLGEINDKEAYKTWNMGQGLAVITPQPEKILQEAEKFGIKAKVAGKVIKDKKIFLQSKGFFEKEKELVFEIE